MTIPSAKGSTTLDSKPGEAPVDVSVQKPTVTLETPSATANARLSRKAKLGRIIALIFAIGTGVTAAAALAALTSGIPFILLASTLCVATTYANYQMTKNDVANVLEGGLKGLFSTDEEDAEGNNVKKLIPWRKRIMLGIGILFSLTFGGALGALTFGSALALSTAFPVLAAVSFLLPPLGVLLGFVTFICLTSLMVKAFSDLAKTENLPQKIKDGFVELFSRHPVRDAGKSTLRFVCERVAVGVMAASLIVLTLGLIAWGKINTLMSCARAFNDILLKIPHASAAATAVVSTVLVNFCALIAQIPFMLKTGLTPILMLFKAPPSKQEQEDMADVPPMPMPSSKKWSIAGLFLASALSSAAMAAIAMAGKVLNALTLLGGFGAFLDGFTSSSVNAILSSKEKVVVTKKIETPSGGSTVKIKLTLGTPVSSPSYTVKTIATPPALRLAVPPSPTQMSISDSSRDDSVARISPRRA